MSSGDETASWLYRPSFPSDWKRAPLYGLARWHNGLAFRNIDFTTGGDPVIKIAEIKDGITDQTKFTESTYEEKHRVRRGDLLFSWSGQPESSIDAFWWRGVDGWLNQHIFKIEPVEGVDSVFFFYLLRYLKPLFVEIARNKQTTGLGHVTKRDLEAMQVGLPDLATQRAVARILGPFDDKIELNRRMSETLEATARAVFKNWFVDFAPVSAKFEGRAPAGIGPATAELFPDGFEESEFGEIPRGWNIAPLGDHLSVLETGGRPQGGVKGITVGVPSVGAESIQRLGYFDFSKTRFVPTEFFSSMRKGVVADRDVLLYKDGGRPGQFEPHVAMFGDGFPFKRFCINEHVYRLRGDHLLPQAFLFFSLSSERMMGEMRVKGTGVAIPGLNSSALRSLRLLLPATEIVRAFAKVADPMIARILAASTESHTLAMVRDTLLPKLLSGELRVRDADRIVERAV